MEDPSAWVYERPFRDTDRHEQERAKNGFSTYDWWNFCEYIAWVNISALEKFKDGMGFPADLKNMEEWQAELDIMIDGFKAHMEIQNDWDADKQTERMKRYERGMALYIKRLPSLWD